MSVILISCREESGFSKVMTDQYPELYPHVFDRDADSLLSYTQHPNEYVRDQAWRALISTPVEDVDGLILKVINANSPQAWMALSAKELSAKQIDQLQDYWTRMTSLRSGISQVLGKQGDEGSLEFLARNFEDIINPESEYEYASAQAIGRLMENYELSEVSTRSILRYAAVIDDENLFRAYFYGLYRSDKALQSEEMVQVLWDTYNWTNSPKIKQYALAISFNSDAEQTFENLSIDKVDQMNEQLAVELAQHTAKLPWSDKLNTLFAKLLDHKNPVVNTVALSELRTHPDYKSDSDALVIEKIVENEEKEASVRLSGIIALSDSKEFIRLTDSLSAGSDYLFNKRAIIYQNALNPEAYLTFLSSYTESDNRMEALFASRSMLSWWNGLSDSQKNASLKQQAHALIFTLLGRGDRSITYETLQFMNASDLITDNDYQKIEAVLGQYALPEDIEVYQAMGSFLKERFESESESLIDSLAAVGNGALNATFQQQGWNVTAPEATPPTFRTPDWDRLAALEFEPVWVLETDKGVIKITMDVISAPATISGMDSLTKAGAYNGIAFHRVVPNFVVQGGDVETGDGYGGPDFVVPTEASELEYRRGMVGIASAGTDTEGSQYFMMHQWAPHLNGRYTIVGKVTEGMEVVDRMLVGDLVIRAYWQSEGPGE